MKENVDLEEFNRQRIENAKQRGHYSEILIFLEDGENMPLTKLNLNGVTNETIAKNIVILKQFQI